MAKTKKVDIEQEIEPHSIAIDVENIEAEDGNVEIIGSNQEYSLTMYLDKRVDPKYFTRFVKGVEAVVRKNDDYRLWLEALREEPCMCQDAFLHNITSSDAEIQLHHFPFNLYTIVRIITEKMLDDGKQVSSFIVADEVIQTHFKNFVGLVPLAVTMHELAHLGKLTILRNQIYGKWEQFYNTYKDYMDDYDNNIIRKLLETKCLEVTDRDLVMLDHAGEEPESDFDLDAELSDDDLPPVDDDCEFEE